MSNLVIAPHPDDEVLGCFSFLNEEAIVLYVTTHHPGFINGENIEESKRLAGKLGYKRQTLTVYEKNTNCLDVYSICELIDMLEKYISQIKPDTVLIPFPSYNQDHRFVHEAALTAMRHHDKNHFVKRILVYEEPDVFDTMNRSFKPQYYRPIAINDKLGAIDVYKSQIRLHRSFNYITAIAGIRGNQSNSEYAEGFEVLRWCE